VKGRGQRFGVLLAHRLEVDVLVHQELQPVEQFARRRLLFHARQFAHRVEGVQRIADQLLLDAGKSISIKEFMTI